MKLFFFKDDSLYKIFKTIEKLKSAKDVTIYIEPAHDFFHNERRAKQIYDLLEQKNRKPTFIVESEKHKVLLDNVWLKVQLKHKKKIIKLFHALYLFFFNIKKFHFYVYTKKNYVFYLVFSFEIWLVFLLFYLLYSLVLPSTKIVVNPAYNVEDIIYNFRYYPHNDVFYSLDSSQITIPYYTGVVDHTYNLTVSIKDITYFQNPSYGTVKMINFGNDPISLIPQTQLITEEWLQYRIKERVNIPGAIWETPWTNYVDVIAQEIDNKYEIMGERGNIPQGTVLYVKNLKQSLYQKEIYAEALYDFAGGQTRTKSTIDDDDLNWLSWNLATYVQTNKLPIIKDQFVDSQTLLLPFDDMVMLEQSNIIFDLPDNVSSGTVITGTINSTISYRFIYRSDLLKWMNTYLDQRQSETIDLIDINKSSLTFYTVTNQVDDVFIIPTKMGIIQWYNFDYDSNGIKATIKNLIVGKPKEEAKQLLLDFDQIGTATIKTTPPRYGSISKVKSRIFIETE